MDRDYVPGIISQGTKHAKHDLSLDYPHDKGVLTLEPPPPCNIVVRWNTDPKTEPLRRFFIDVYAGLVELRDIVAKLGLPYTTVAQKLPYYRYVKPARTYYTLLALLMSLQCRLLHCSMIRWFVHVAVKNSQCFK